MSITQISVIARNEPGSMAKITKTLANAGVNGIAMNTAELYEGGAVRLIVDKPEQAIEALEKAHMLVVTTQVTAVYIAPKPGSLADLLSELAVKQVDIAYMYTFPSNKDPNKAILIFKSKQNDVEHVLAKLDVQSLGLPDLI